MTKRISITIPDHCFESCLGDVKGTLSQHIAKLIYLGSDAMLNNPNETRTRLLSIVQENQELANRLSKVNGEYEALKNKIKGIEDPVLKEEEIIWLRKDGLSRSKAYSVNGVYKFFIDRFKRFDIKLFQFKRILMQIEEGLTTEKQSIIGGKHDPQ